MVAAETPAVAVVGKTWTLHVTKIVGTTLEENLAMVADSVAFLKQQGREVVFDCEHFFDGFRADPDYALAVVKAASAAGADWIAMCDTNGGSLPGTITEVVGAVKRAVPTPLGIHTHNDCDVAVANAFAGDRGRLHPGPGDDERLGRAVRQRQPDLGHRRAAAEDGPPLRAGREPGAPHRAVARGQRDRQHPPARARPLRRSLGLRAQGRDARRGGGEDSRQLRAHRRPSGSATGATSSSRSCRGAATSACAPGELGIDVQGNEKRVLEHIKELESQGYQFEAAEGSFELLGRRSQPGYVAPFDVLDLVVISERRRGNSMFAEATVKLKIGDEIVHEVAEGSGPVHALDGAFHKALNPHFPTLRDVRLADYKVRILDPDAATGAKTRVLIEAARGEERWSTIGVSQNIIEASATALADALELPLARLASARVPESAVG